MPSERALLWLWYRGTRFRGWQRQTQGPTVQEEVEAQLHTLGVPGGLAAAGRTDRGVHARQQLASLRVPLSTDVGRLGLQLGGADWGCAGAAAAPAGFHAQWTPSQKEYRYRLAPGPPPTRWHGYVWNLSSESRLQGASVEPALLLDVLSEALGTRDFFAFHAASSIRRLRTLSRVELSPDTPALGLWEVRMHGAGFGRYQVRALVGGAALVASGRLPREHWRAALERAERFPGLLAPPEGLVLWALDYGGRSPFDADVGSRPPRGPPFTDGG